MVQFPSAQLNELNAMAKPRLEALYQDASEFFGPRSKKLLDQVAQKGTVGGDVGMYRLFAPAVLLGLGGYPDISYETAVVAKNIPFIGDYGRWNWAGSTIAGAFRVLTQHGDARANELEQWLSIPQNDGLPGPPVINNPMVNRLNGRLLDHYLKRGVDYRVPLRQPQASNVVITVSELAVMWAFGGSDEWPRTRIDEELEAARQLLDGFITQ
ncbi:hypothetical protein ACPCIR_02050 [Mycobacterium sp. NPDC051198]